MPGRPRGGGGSPSARTSRARCPTPRARCPYPSLPGPSPLAGDPAAPPSAGFRGPAPYGRHPLDEQPLVLPAALGRHHTTVGDQSADLRVEFNHRAGRRRLGRSGGHVKRLVAGRPERHRSNVWGPPRAPFAVGPGAALVPCRDVLHTVATDRRGSSRGGDPNPVVARRRGGARPPRSCVHASTRSVTISVRPGPTEISSAPFHPGVRVRGDENHTDSKPIGPESGPNQARIRPGSGPDSAGSTGASAGGGRRAAGGGSVGGTISPPPTVATPDPAFAAAVTAAPSSPQRMCRPEIARAMTRRWISLVPSKMV